jgi:hypothetical protein
VRRSLHNRLDALEASLPPPPIAFLLREEWEAILADHGGNESRAIRELGCRPVFVPDETTRAEANDQFNNPVRGYIRFTEPGVWDKIIDCNDVYPSVFNTFPFVLCGDRMTYEALCGKNRQIVEFGIGLTEDEQRVVEERAALENA